MGQSRKIALAALAVLAAGLGGCGGSSEGEQGRHPDYAAALAGSPPPLAALHREADDLLGGGTSAFERRIAALRGYPVIVNVWASWCGNCRYEFPTLQGLSARYGKRVAFLGVDSQDSNGEAKAFLGEDPVPYPSYADPDRSIAESLGVTSGIPDTAFYNRAGKLVYLKRGPYSQGSDLEADVRSYALGS